MDSNKLLNHEAERSVLGACLLDDVGAMPEASILAVDDFTDQRHRLIWSAILELYRKSAPVDLVTASAELKHRGHFHETGGSAYLAELVDFVVTVANVGYYIQMVCECSKRRKLAAVGRKIITEANEAESAEEARDIAEALFADHRNTSSIQSGPLAVAELVNPALKALEERGGRGRGVTSGFSKLDKMTCGFQPGDLIIIAARPSMGKTALCLNFAKNASGNGSHVLLFSLEMSRAQLINRLLSDIASVDSNKLRNKALDDKDWHKAIDAGADLCGLPLDIDDRCSITVLDIRTAARQVQRSKGLDLIVIDYLQLIKPVKSHQIREREVAEMSRSLKGLAKELDVPIILLAQLNRNLETGATPRKPVPADLRESGAIEQDADLILFPWRESVYCEACKSAQRDCGKGHYRTAEIIIGKQRNGPIGSVQAAWIGEFSRFEPI